ncbi:MAG: hypothetical protein LUE91_04240, partial [Oscillospiraceae bacterium]|nr:hypothetical protein [Oscillospiraceae bacterium]
MQQDYTMANLVLQSVYPNNCILVDEKGVPSVMVKIPKVTLADLGIADSDTVHPAFLVNGKEVDAIYLSKYSNTIIDGCAASMPAVDPAASIRIDAAMEACSSKGKGWHLMTRMEYALIAQICARNGFLPWGNNLHGRDYRETLCTAIASNDTGHRATGTGPLTWYHDRTYAGIADLNGNTSVWVGGVRLYYG